MNSIQRALVPARPSQPVVDPAAWYPDEVISFGGGELALTPAEATEIADATVRFESQGGDPAQMTARDFPLTQMGMKLGRIRTEMKDGLGFTTLRGAIGPSSRRSAAIALHGLACHLGAPTESHATSIDRLHADPCDITAIAFLDANRASVAPSITAYNELLAQEPQLVDDLQSAPPVFRFRDGYLSVAAANAGPGQRGALDRFMAVATGLRHPLSFAAGDILFVCNPVAMHDVASENEVLQVWLMMEGLRPRHSGRDGQ